MKIAIFCMLISFWGVEESETSKHYVRHVPYYAPTVMFFDVNNLFLNPDSSFKFQTERYLGKSKRDIKPNKFHSLEVYEGVYSTKADTLVLWFHRKNSNLNKIERKYLVKKNKIIPITMGNLQKRNAFHLIK